MEEKFENGKQKFKFITPIYIPVHKLKNYIAKNMVEIETKILKSVY